MRLSVICASALFEFWLSVGLVPVVLILPAKPLMKSHLPEVSCLAAFRLERRPICALALLSVLISALLPAIASGMTAHSDISFDISICRGLPGEEDRDGEHGPFAGLSCICTGICTNYCSAGPTATAQQPVANALVTTALYAFRSAGAERLMRGPAFPSLRGPPVFA